MSLVGIVCLWTKATEYVTRYNLHLFFYLVPVVIEAFVQTLHKLDNPLIEVTTSPFNQSVTASFICEHSWNPSGTNFSVSGLNCHNLIEYILQNMGKLHEAHSESHVSQSRAST
jgi:hypothetical protein